MGQNDDWMLEPATHGSAKICQKEIGIALDQSVACVALDECHTSALPADARRMHFLRGPCQHMSPSIFKRSAFEPASLEFWLESIDTWSVDCHGLRECCRKMQKDGRPRWPCVSLLPLAVNMKVLFDPVLRRQSHDCLALPAHREVRTPMPWDVHKLILLGRARPGRHLACSQEKEGKSSQTKP